MRLAVRKLVADDHNLEPLHDTQPGKHHFGIQAGRVGYRHHGDIGTIRQGKQFHQTRQRFDFPRRELAERFFLLRHDGGPALRRLARQEPLADRSIGKSHQLFRGAVAIEHMAMGCKDLIERFQMKRIGVRQCAVNVEQQRFPESRHACCYAVGVPWRHWPPEIFAAAITAWVRLSTPSFCRIAETCALMVASDTPSS